MNKVELLHAEVSDHLEKICKLFTQRPKITIVIRTPWLADEGKEGDVLLTDDDLDVAIAAINKLRNKPLIGEAAIAKH
jgi:hypothetical protein